MNQLEDCKKRASASETRSTGDQKSISTGPDQTNGPEHPGDRSIQCARPESPVPSVLSMKSNTSINQPVNFSGPTANSAKVLLESPDSPIGTSVWSVLEDPWESHWENQSCHDASVPGLVPCCICPVKAVKSCLTCCASYCDLHVRQHYTAPALQKHRLVEVAGDVVEQKFCQQHHRELELYCTTDHTYICALCAVMEHSGHKILFNQPEDQREHLGESKWPIEKDVADMDNLSDLPPPGPIQFTSVTTDSVSLCWGTPEGPTGPQRFRVNWKQEGTQQSLIVPVTTITIEGLSPGEQYEFSVATIGDNGNQSPCVVASAQTVIPQPQDLTVTTDLSTASVTWSKALDQVSYLLSLCRDGEEEKIIYTKDLRCSLSGLQPGTEYKISVSTVVNRGYKSEAVAKSFYTADMASSSSFLSEEQLRYSICLDVFTDPVSTPCGHNFCMGCIKEYWDNCSQTQCPVCKEIYHKRPELLVNTIMLELSDGFRKSQLIKTHTGVQQMIQDRQRKIQEIEESVKFRENSTEEEISASVEIFTGLLRFIERSQDELLEVMNEKQRAAERQAEGLIKDLQQEITELQRSNSELEKISHTEDHLHLQQIYPTLCSPPHTKNWTDVSIDPPLSVETVRRSVCELETSFRKQMEKLTEIQLNKARRHAVDVTLDPDSAHPNLILSGDKKQVRLGDKRQNLPDKEERFDPCVGVLAEEVFSSGRFYYEVEVRGKTGWDFGVARESINRKGEIMPTPQNGYWTVCLWYGKEYKALDDPPVLLSLSKKPQKLGVFVDYEEGLVSFYDVENSSHIYSFTGQSFSEKLYPYFSPGLNEGDTNSAPLIISPVPLTN
ncbi:E3 ubiquitin-protein ligase TRIM39-like isoform X6 [Denticeps clupeoides]|nr:E3 ubiquitin-protein ligase TRIM39-like isoform X6 [Denticeps clupeoides]